MIEDAEVVIPTLFRPVTLGPLVDTLEAQGVRKVTVIEGMPVNDAWRKGMADASKRWLFILNDDIEIGPRFVMEILFGLGAGLTFAYGRRVNGFTGATRVMVTGMAQGAQMGGAFAMDMACRIPPIPEVFKIYHGDDWLFWQHARHGCCGEVSSAEYKTDGAFSCAHKDINERMVAMLGDDLETVVRRDHLASRRYFIIPNSIRFCMDTLGSDVPLSNMDVNRAFMGCAAGLLE